MKKRIFKKRSHAFIAAIFLLIVVFAAYMVNSMNEEIMVKISTSKGDIVVSLDEESAPQTVKNFLRYVQQDFYDKTVFHRVIEDFMIQGGGFDEDGEEKKTHAPIELESDNKLKNKKGTIAMARTNQPDSATSQFFINTEDNGFLDSSPTNDGYAVFGKVVEGMDVVQRISEVDTGVKNNMRDWPEDEVIIKEISVI